MNKLSFLSVIAVLGGLVSEAFGGWSSALTTLIVFMTIDYITGLMLAGIFKKSKKTENGSLESRVGWKGLCRKGVTLLIVLVAVRLDMAVGTTFVKDAVITAFSANEALSIIENSALMGVPIPKPLTNAIEVLKSKADDNNENA